MRPRVPGLSYQGTATQGLAGCVHPEPRFLGFRKGAGLSAQRSLCLVLSCGQLSVADLLCSTGRDTDNCSTFNRCVWAVPSGLQSHSAPPSSCRPGFFCLWTQVGTEGRASCSTLRGPGQDKFSHSSKSLQEGQHLRFQAGKAPQSPAYGCGGGETPSAPTVGLGWGGVENNRTHRGHCPGGSPAGGPAWKAPAQPQQRLLSD